MNPDALTVKRHSAILVAPFDAKSSPKAEIANSLREFWEVCCTQIGEPKGGWPQELVVVLDQVISKTTTLSNNRTTSDKEDFTTAECSMDVDEGYEADVSLLSDKTHTESIDVESEDEEDENRSDDEITLVSPISKSSPEVGSETNIRPSVAPTASLHDLVASKLSSVSYDSRPLYAVNHEGASSQTQYNPTETPLLGAKFIAPSGSTPLSLKRKRLSSDSSDCSPHLPSHSPTCKSQDEKENVNPLMPSPQTSTLKTGKRNFPQDTSIGDLPSVKKLRFAKDKTRSPFQFLGQSSSESDDLQAVEEYFFVEKCRSPSSPAAQDKRSRMIDHSEPPAKLPSLLGHLTRQPSLKAFASKAKTKRRRMFLDAVEVPTLQQLERDRCDSLFSARTTSVYSRRDLHSPRRGLLSSDDSSSSGNETLIDSGKNF